MMVEVGSMRALDILSTAAAVIAEGEVMQLGAAKNTRPPRTNIWRLIRAKTAELFAAACEVGPVIAGLSKDEQAACRSFGMNLGVAFQLVDDALDYGGKSAKLGKNVGDDFRDGKITLPVVLSFRRGSDSERRVLAAHARGRRRDRRRSGNRGVADEQAPRAGRHDQARAPLWIDRQDALALFPDSRMKAALVEAVDFSIGDRVEAHHSWPALWSGCAGSGRIVLTSVLRLVAPQPTLAIKAPDRTSRNRRSRALSQGVRRNSLQNVSDIRPQIGPGD